MSFCYLLSGLCLKKHINVYNVVKQNKKKRSKVIGIQMTYSFWFQYSKQL